MDGRRNNGGHSTKGKAGRKKGGFNKNSVSNKIKKYVEEFVVKILEDEIIYNKVKEEIRQLSIQEGWIYVIKDLNTNQYKIGVTQTNNPNQRLALYSAHKMNIELCYIDLIDDCYNVESESQSMFENKRIKGDWFDLNDSDIFKLISFINRNKYSKVYYGRW